MANQRKKGKKKVGIWMTQEEIATAKKLAKVRGITVSDLLKTEVTKEMERT